MSQENVAVVHLALHALADFDHEQATAHFAPDAEWHNTSAFPGPRVCVGPDAILDFWKALGEGFSEQGREIEQVWEAGDLVVIGVHQWGSGRASGVPFDVRFAAIFEVVGQRIVRVDIHGDYAKALEAVGLSEPSVQGGVDTLRAHPGRIVGGT
jgi:ketosteroid isomerase-like protein